MTICVARMLQESAIFFGASLPLRVSTSLLILVVAVAFHPPRGALCKGCYALDASDGNRDIGFKVVNMLLEGIMQCVLIRCCGFS